jgi:type II secretory pathway component PulK
MSTPVIVLILAVLAIVVAGLAWRRRSGAQRPHHLVMILLAILVILAGLGFIFTPHGH